MHTAHPLPERLPMLWNVSRRSRRPLIMLRLDEEAPKQRWSRQSAVQRSTYYVAHELTVSALADLEHADETFAKIMAYHAMVESGALYVPEWFKLTARAKARIEAVTRVLGAQNAASGATESARQPLALLVVNDGAGRFIGPDVSRIGSSTLNADEWLYDVWESQQHILADTVRVAFTSPVRDVAAARTAARELAVTGASMQEVERHLTVFGYENPNGTLGRWTRHVAAIVPPEMGAGK